MSQALVSLCSTVFQILITLQGNIDQAQAEAQAGCVECGATRSWGLVRPARKRWEACRGLKYLCS